MAASEFGKFYAQQAGTLKDFGESVVRGIDVGSQLAQRQIELDVRKAEAEMRKKEHEFKKNDYINSFLKQALSDDATPAQRKVYLNQYEKIGKQLGKFAPEYSVSKDTDLQMIVNEDDRRRLALEQMVLGSSSPELVAMIGQMSPEDIRKTAQKVAEEKATALKNAQLFGNKNFLEQEKQFNARLGNVLKNIEGEIPPAILFATRSQDPVAREQALLALEQLSFMQKGKKSQAKESRESEKVDIQRGNLAERKKFTEAYVRNVNNQAGNISFDNQKSKADLTKSRREEWTKANGDARRSSIAIQSIENSLKNPSPAARVAAFKQFQKLFDDSVIYPGEFAQQQEWKDLLNRASGVVSALQGKGDYTEKDVQDMLQVGRAMNGFYQGAVAERRASIDKELDEINAQVPKQYRINKETVFGPKKEDKKSEDKDLKKGKKPVKPPSMVKATAKDVKDLIDKTGYSREKVLKFLEGKGYDVRGL